MIGKNIMDRHAEHTFIQVTNVDNQMRKFTTHHFRDGRIHAEWTEDAQVIIWNDGDRWTRTQRPESTESWESTEHERGGGLSFKRKLIGKQGKGQCFMVKDEVRLLCCKLIELNISHRSMSAAAHAHAALFGVTLEDNFPVQSTSCYFVGELGCIALAEICATLLHWTEVHNKTLCLIADKASNKVDMIQGDMNTHACKVFILIFYSDCGSYFDYICTSQVKNNQVLMPHIFSCKAYILIFYSDCGSYFDFICTP